MDGILNLYEESTWQGLIYCQVLAMFTSWAPRAVLTVWNISRRFYFIFSFTKILDPGRKCFGLRTWSCWSVTKNNVGFLQRILHLRHNYHRQTINGEILFKSRPSQLPRPPERRVFKEHPIPLTLSMFYIVITFRMMCFFLFCVHWLFLLLY